MARPIALTSQVHQAVVSQALTSQSKRRPSPRAVDANALKQHSVNAAIAVERPVLDHIAVDRNRIGSPSGEEAALDTPTAAVIQRLQQQLERDWSLDFNPPSTFTSTHREHLEKRWRDAKAGKVLISGRGQCRSERRAAPLKRRRVSRPAYARHVEETEVVDPFIKRSCLFLKTLEDEFEAGMTSAARWSERRTALDMHLRSMGRTRVLKKEEEGKLFAILNRACDYGLSRTERATDEELQAASRQHGVSGTFLKAVQSNAFRARNLLTRFNLRLVMATAKRVVGSRGLNGVQFADLLPEGRHGLVTAMLKFEPARGCKFASYAVWHIRQRVRSCIMKESRVVHVPAYVQEKLPRVLNAEAKLQEMRGRDAVVTDQDIADVLGLSTDKVRLVRQCLGPVMYLDDPSFTGSSSKSEPSDVSLLDTITDDSAEIAHEEERKDQLVQECLNAVLQTLHPRERNIIRLRFGLNDERRQVSRHEIADAYGLSQERIRQIEDDAVRKLRVPWRRQVLLTRTEGALFD